MLKNDVKKLILWASPGFGMIDVWLPVIKEIKKNNIVIITAFPEPSSLRLEESNSDLFYLTEQISDGVIYRGYSGRLFYAKSLIEAKNNVCIINNIDDKILKLSRRLINGRASKLLILKSIGKCIRYVFKIYIKIKENIRGCDLYNESLLSEMDGILLDITVENKPVNTEIKKLRECIPRFSMLHGLGAGWVESYMCCPNKVKIRQNVYMYTTSILEESGYNNCFGIKKRNILSVGMPRHDSDWIDYIRSQPKAVNNKDFDAYVFIISRPASPFNTIERKTKAIKHIYDIVCIKHKLKLVIKSHPKESLEGCDGRIYDNILGKENYGKNWVYSNEHPFKIGSKAIFCISFYSGVPIDMLAIKKPTIEYLDLNGLTHYDNEASLRGKNGEPVFQYRYTNLVLGASSKEELERHVNSILYDYNKTLSYLYSNYTDYFSLTEGASKKVANDIHNKLTQI